VLPSPRASRLPETAEYMSPMAINRYEPLHPMHYGAWPAGGRRGTAGQPQDAERNRVNDRRNVAGRSDDWAMLEGVDRHASRRAQLLAHRRRPAAPPVLHRRQRGLAKVAVDPARRPDGPPARLARAAADRRS